MPLLKNKLKILKCNIALLIFLSASFVLGFILGIFFRNNCCDSPYFNGVYAYFICIFNVETSVLPSPVRISAILPSCNAIAPIS